MNEVTSVQWHSSGQFVLSAARDSQIKVSHSELASGHVSEEIGYFIFLLLPQEIAGYITLDTGC